METVTNRVQVWSCGGGVQSAAIGALIVQGRLPKPDLAVIADTQRERSTTWRYFADVLKPQLASVGVNLIRVSKFTYATVDLWGGADCDRLLIPAFVKETKTVESLFTFQQTTIGKSPGFCSNEWKTRVIDRWLREQGVKRATMWLGISTDEMRRVRAGEFRYPLIEDIPMNRADCLRLLAELGWPPPRHSACYICPNATNAEWREMRDNSPDDWAKAVRFDRKIRKRDPRVYLHSSCMPLDEADLGVSSEARQQGDCAGMCWV